MSEHETLDEAILALRAMRSDPSEASRTLERIGMTLEHRSPTRIIARLALEKAAVLGLALLLATTCYAAFFGLPAELSSWFSVEPRTAARAGARNGRAPPPYRAIAKPATQAAQSAIDAPTTAQEPLSLADVTHASGPASARKARASVSGRRTRTAGAAAREMDAMAAFAPDAAPSRAVEPERLYREAHRLHFVTRDYAAALSAWEHYLRSAGDAALVVEARYNRALCLVRLGDREAARSALISIARGEHGAYRQREARALLRVLH